MTEHAASPAPLLPYNEAALTLSIAQLDDWFEKGLLLDEVENDTEFCENIGAVLHELKRLRYVGAMAIDMVIASLSPVQTRLLTRLSRKPDFWTYPVRTRGVALQTCMALVKRGIMEGDAHRPFENAGQGFVRLTAFGEAIRNILIARGLADDK